MARAIVLLVAVLSVTGCGGSDVSCSATFDRRSASECLVVEKCQDKCARAYFKAIDGAGARKIGPMSQLYDCKDACRSLRAPLVVQEQ